MRIGKKLRADIVKIYGRIEMDYETGNYFKERHNDMQAYALWNARAGAKWDVLQILLNIDEMTKVIRVTHKIVNEERTV